VRWECPPGGGTKRALERGGRGASRKGGSALVHMRENGRRKENWDLTGLVWGSKMDEEYHSKSRLDLAGELRSERRGAPSLRKKSCPSLVTGLLPWTGKEKGVNNKFWGEGLGEEKPERGGVGEV